MNRFLFSRTDISPLVVFRICFGILIALESFGAIATGWVHRTFIEPSFTFTFIGFEWLQPLPGSGMYVYYGLMGVAGLAIALGWRYRFWMISFTVLWTATYLMQKTSYNNHYYLLILISGIMCFLPAHRYYSLDVKKKPDLRDGSMFAYVRWIFILQLLIVYTYAAIAKLYEGWLDFSFIALLMESKKDYFLIGSVLQQPAIHKAIAIFGLVFDFLIVPALLWKKTRIPALLASVFFHIFNSIVFQIGIFPYLSLVLIVFFFDPETIRQVFFKSKPAIDSEYFRPANRNFFIWGSGLYFLVQVLLPLRHHFIADDVLWTEEGHRMSWRMMLRSRSGMISFRVVDRATGRSRIINPEAYVTPRQLRKVKAYPDFIWQFAQFLGKKFEEEGKNIGVYVSCRVKINQGEYYPFIDPEVDLTKVSWDHFHHHSWIMPSPTSLSKKESVK